MTEEYLYLKIANSIRRDIENGVYKTGESLPTLRNFSETWHCTIGTVQRAFQKLASEGLISSHVGKGTKVMGPVSLRPVDSLRWANLLNRTESFLLGILTADYTQEEVSESFRVALDRWQEISRTQTQSDSRTLNFAGSHDPAIAWLATHFDECSPGHKLHVEFSGSLSGLRSLAEGKADIAGSHLWDAATGTYNTPFLRQMFPQERLAMITLAHRRMGFLVKKGNPKNLQGIGDLTRSDIKFINRNSGSGTRVFLDSLLKKNAIQPESIRGYANQKNTHSEVAAEVAEGHADVGVGLEAAAKAYNLDFYFLTLERYDLVVKAELFDQKPIRDLVAWLKKDDFRLVLNHLGGYEGRESGDVHWT